MRRKTFLIFSFPLGCLTQRNNKKMTIAVAVKNKNTWATNTKAMRAESLLWPSSSEGESDTTLWRVASPGRIRGVRLESNATLCRVNCLSGPAGFATKRVHLLFRTKAETAERTHTPIHAMHVCICIHNVWGKLNIHHPNHNWFTHDFDMLKLNPPEAPTFLNNVTWSNFRQGVKAIQGHVCTNHKELNNEFMERSPELRVHKCTGTNK